MSVDVVAYGVAGQSYAWWCGWCRQWRYVGALEEPALRPGCPPKRNEDCPTIGTNDTVRAWPVRLVRPLSLVAGDGRPGGRLPKAARLSDAASDPVVASGAKMMAHSKTAVGTANYGAARGWDVRVMTARGTWQTKTTSRVADVTVVRFTRAGTILLSCWVDNAFEYAFTRTERVAGNQIKKLLRVET